MRPGIGPDGDTAFPVKLVVEPLPSTENDPLYMIAFVETGQPRPADGDLPPGAELPEANAGLAHIERENRDLRERLQSVAEQHAPALEELRSSN